MPTSKIFVYVLCGDRRQAETIADALVAAGLVACASIGSPVESRYVWRGKLERGEEIPLTLKTTLERWPEVEAEVRRLHSYEVPEILALPVVAGSQPYLDWMDRITGPARS